MHTCPTFPIARICSVALVLALACCTGASAQNPEGRHEIQQLVATSPESIVGVSVDENSTYYVWAFNPVSGRTTILSSGRKPSKMGGVRPLRGSSADLAAWTLTDLSSFPPVHCVTLAAGGDPLDLNKHFGDYIKEGWFHSGGVMTSTIGILPKKGLLLLHYQANSQWHIGSYVLSDSDTHKYLLFDVGNRKTVDEVERKPSLPGPELFCSLGQQENLFLSVSCSFKAATVKQLTLLGLDPLRVLGVIDLPDLPMALQPGASKSEAVMVCTSATDWTYYKITCQETGGPNAIKMEAFDQLDVDPDNVSLARWRDGAKVWVTEDPGELRIQPEQGEAIVQPMGVWGWILSMDDSCSVLATYRPRQFRVWTIGPSEVTLAGIFRVFDSAGPQPIEIRPIQPSEELPQPEEAPEAGSDPAGNG